ncbi:acyltransferase family protein [Streptomyces sp. DSM 42041]|uniref:Acyltransferase family protein n=1 Tax=Streptomyces hazeniae TaxID=3075538 RepID=A0ABU2NSU9_9ACTN|nr:acyltransferase family protein [Streptomyces sp. DSM 42041]MDT0379686.1 acyltransferase family protein [Streptomyces sp. DSM 42041]
MQRPEGTTGPVGTTVAERPPGTREGAPPREQRFRGDVEGLRALAVCVVLAYHAGATTFAGGYVGVDVFFVVSGYLITGLLLRELQQTGSIALTRFYARRMRRLLPLACLVLLTAAGAAWLLFSPVERQQVFEDVIASALYAVNWQQAAEAVDYSAVGTAASPVQHFWSLSVEEQFYLVWPLLLLACGLGSRRRAPRVRLALGLGSVAAASFAYSVVLTTTEAGVAYFSTLTRGWELAAGGLLALVPAARLRALPRRAPAVLGCGGLAAVLTSVTVYDDTTPFPGVPVLLPVLGTVALIAAGTAGPHPAARVLELPPVRYLGRVSYSWYLWHWPAIVFATAFFSGLPTSILLLVVVLSLIPAALSHRLVEEYFRRARAFAPNGRSLALGGGCTALAVLAAALSWNSVPRVPQAEPHEVAGARTLLGGEPLQHTADALRPLPEKAADDKGRAHRDGCLVAQRDTRSPACVYGDTTAGTTVVLYGDSHAMQYAPALERVAQKRKWRLVVLTKSGCTPADLPTWNPRLKREYTECAEWRERTLERIERDEKPALVVTGNLATVRAVADGDRLGAEDSARRVRTAYADTLERLQGAGARTVVVADNPHPPEDVPACVSAHLEDLSQCVVPERTGLDFTPVNRQAAGDVSGARLVDPGEALCRDGACPAVIGNALVYRNGAHLTATYMETMADWLDGELPSVR